MYFNSSGSPPFAAYEKLFDYSVERRAERNGLALGGPRDLRDSFFDGGLVAIAFGIVR